MSQKGDGGILLRLMSVEEYGECVHICMQRVLQSNVD